MKLQSLSLLLLAAALPSLAQDSMKQELSDWQMQDSAKVAATGDRVSLPSFDSRTWYRATVPGTVLTTLVDNKVYPEPPVSYTHLTLPTIYSV